MNPDVHEQDTDTDTATAATEPAVEPEARPECMACGHPASGHDRIALRYCDATVERALTRRCICQHP